MVEPAPATEQHSPRLGWWILSLLACLAVPAVWAVLATRRDGSCRNVELVAAYAGAPGKFQVLAGPTVHQACGLADLDALHARLVVGALWTLVAAAVLFVVCSVWWRHAWLTRRFVAAAPVKWLAPLAAACDLAAKAIVLFAVHIRTSGGSRSVELGGLAAFVLPGLVWVKVFAFAAAWIAAMLTLFAVFSRRRLPQRAAEGVAVPTPVIEGLGVCCSGGGIRAAGVALGALGVLERTTLVVEHQPDGSVLARTAPGPGTGGLLGKANYIASVSGGGYTVGGWRSASNAAPPTDLAKWPTGVIGDPGAYPSPPPVDADSSIGQGPVSLYRHLQQRREFLRSGRGGFPASVLLALVFLLFHLLLWALLLVVVAWPIGRLTSTWFVVGGQSTDPAAFIDMAGRQLPFEPRMYGPAVAFGIVAVGVFASCMVQWNTARRGALMKVGKGLTAAALIIAALLIGVPWMLDVVYPFITTNQAAAAISGIASAGGVVAVVVSLVEHVLKPRLLRLGGVLLLIAAILLAVVVAGQAALKEGVFALNWAVWGAVTGVLVVGYFALCPRWWSLHTIYRNRLRGAFVTSRDPSTAPRALAKRPRTIVDAQGRDTGVTEAPGDRMWPVRQSRELLLAEYEDAPRPVHLVCCSVARSSRRATGLRALSFVLDPQQVTYYDVGYGARRVTTTAYSAPTAQWIQGLGSARARQAEGTLSAAISVSGAAVAPAMGRLDQGSTNSLLALLNLRLGTWWPNPRYIPHDGALRFPWVRLSYLLKEIVGYFDANDHHVYVTDGGHRENLGLVELLRRGCRTVVCIDASGDTPGSFTTLRQAAELARLEVHAHIDLTSLPAPTTAMPDGAQHVLPVEYRDADGITVIGHGTVVYVGAALFASAPDDLLAYGLEDTRFPHYSTGDQFLTEVQFRRLADFGVAATEAALRDGEVVDALAAAIG